MSSGTAAAREHLLSWGGPVQVTNRIERSYRWLRQLYLHFVGAVRHGLSHGITDVFTIGIGFAAAAFLLTLVFPHIELTTWEGDR